MSGGIFNGPTYSPSLRGFGATPAFRPMTMALSRPPTTTASDSDSGIGLLGGLGIGALVLIGVGALVIGPVMGYYVGKKLGTKWGWFWGGFGGAPGLAAMQAYRSSKGRAMSPNRRRRNRRRCRKMRRNASVGDRVWALLGRGREPDCLVPLKIEERQPEAFTVGYMGRIVGPATPLSGSRVPPGLKPGRVVFFQEESIVQPGVA